MQVRIYMLCTWNWRRLEERTTTQTRHVDTGDTRIDDREGDYDAAWRTGGRGRGIRDRQGGERGGEETSGIAGKARQERSESRWMCGCAVISTNE